MIMQDQSKRLSQPLPWTRTSRLAVLAAVLALVVAGAVAAVIASTAGSPTRRGCIEVTVPSTLGGAGSTLSLPAGRHSSEFARRTLS